MLRAEKTHVYSNKNWVKQMSEAITLRKTLIAAALTAAAGGALAAELGSLMVYSAAGEPLDAELTIRDVDPKAEQLMVRLAPASTYRRVGKEVVLDLNDISLTLLRKNPYTVKIKGKDAVNAQKFPLIVELSEAGKLSAKLYEVKLQDRPEAPMVKEGVGDGSKTAAPIVDASTGDRTQVPSAAKQPVRSAAAPKVESAASTKPAVKSAVPSAAPTAKETSKPAAEPVYTPPVREPVKTAQTTAQKPAQPAVRTAAKPAPKAAVKLPLNPADYDLDQPFLVQDGMTMWSIATLYRPRYPQASMDQILVAFVRANPGAYERGRVNGVKIGSRLKAPLADEVASVGLDEAWALVRVAPNADARKAPSAKTLKRAQQRMKKEAPALWRKWNAQQPKAKPAPKAEAKAVEPKAKAKPEVKEQPEAKPAVEPKSEAKPAADPLAETLAKADAEHDAKLQAQTQPQEQKAPETPVEQPAAQSEQPKTAPEPTPVPAMPALEEESDEGSGGFWGALIGVLVVLAAAAGGAWYWMKQRGGALRRREENLGVVKFRKAEASQPEQLEGTQEMLKRRLESERATQRMQTEQTPAEPSQPEAAAPVQVNARIEPTLGEVKTQQTPAASGFNVAAAYVGDDKEGSSDEMPTVQATAEALAGKLITARTYIGVGAFAEAERVLHEVWLSGSQEQRRQAAELFEQIAKAKADGGREQ